MLMPERVSVPPHFITLCATCARRLDSRADAIYVAREAKPFTYTCAACAQQERTP
jgi:hypothetical protein